MIEMTSSCMNSDHETFTKDLCKLIDAVQKEGLYAEIHYQVSAKEELLIYSAVVLGRRRKVG